MSTPAEDPPTAAEAFKGSRVTVSKRPSEHTDPMVRWQRRIRNVRRWIYGAGAGAASATLLRMPSPMVGWTRWVFEPAMRKMMWQQADQHLQIAFGDEMSAARRTEVLRAMFRGAAKLPSEVHAMIRAGESYFDDHVDDEEGRRKLNDFERKWGGGWIGVTGHLGNWEVLGQWGYYRALRPTAGAIGKRLPNPHLNKVLVGLRARQGMETLYRDDPPGKIVRLLRDGHQVGVVPDQDVPSLAGVFIDFMGQPAYTPVGPARLAMTAKVPLVCGAMLRRDNGFYLHIGDPIYPDAKARPKRAELLRLTRAWSDDLEAIIRAEPEQWLWFHDRWKTTPEKLESRGRKRMTAP